MLIEFTIVLMHFLGGIPSSSEPSHFFITLKAIRDLYDSKGIGQLILNRVSQNF